MRNRIALLAVLVSAAVATANVEIFFTNAASNPWVAPGPASDFMPTAGNGTDWSADGYKPNFANFPSAYSALTLVAPGETAYIWIKFNTDTQVGPINNSRLQGLDLIWSQAPTDVAWYVEDDTNGQQGFRRWDGAYTPPNFPEFKKAHQVLVAVNGTGIKNNAFNQEIGLYNGTSRIALLGAVKFQQTGFYNFTLGTLGINFNSAPTAPPVEFGTLTVPEPVGLVLLALCLLNRRR